jgi:hypothetical protein
MNNAINLYMEMMKSGFLYRDQIERKLGLGHMAESYEARIDQYRHRSDFVAHISWCLLCQEVIDAVRGLGSKIVGVGCGSGYLEAALLVNGIDVVATDVSMTDKNRYGFKSAWMDILPMPAVDAVAKFIDRDVFMAWPCHDLDWATQALKLIDKPGRRLIYVGERYGGCNANSEFFEILEANFKEVEFICIPQWFGIHDGASIYVRR